MTTSESSIKAYDDWYSLAEEQIKFRTNLNEFVACLEMQLGGKITPQPAARKCMNRITGEPNSVRLNLREQSLLV